LKLSIDMIENPGIGNLRTLLTLTKPTGKSVSFKVGAIVRAEVLNTTDKGEAILRLATTGSDKGASQGTIIKAFSEIPLTKGQNILLEVLNGKNNITMRFIGNSQNTAETSQANIPAKFLNMLAQLSHAKLGNMEFHNLFTMLNSLPQSIKTSIPEFQNLGKLLFDIKNVDGKFLKAFIETSGVAFETRLKTAILNDPGSMLQNLMALQTEGDLKALLMKLQRLFKDRNTVNILRQTGYNMAELSSIVDKFLKNIEFFQLTSRLNDMFYTFLPVLWDDLRDGEFLFRKNREGGRESYTCDINLDIESLGKLSISVTILDKSFYITFFTERNEVKDLIQLQKHILESRFASQGLSLKAINFNYKKDIPFGKAAEQGVDVKI